MIELFRASIRMMTPLILAALGGCWTLQTGILNISQEGAMLLGAFFAAMGNHFMESWVGGLFCGVAAAVAFNLLFALFCVNLRANIWVVGMTLNILADSLSVLLLKSIFHVKGYFSSPFMEKVPDVDLGWLSAPLDRVVGDFSLVVWGTLFLVLAMLWVDRKAVLGLRLKAAGENEEALAAAGVSVLRLRYFALVLNGVLVGAAGSFLSISYLTLFNQGMSSGRGWIAVAAVIFGDGKLGTTLGAAAAFGLVQAGGNALQNAGVNSNGTLMLPYVCILGALFWKALRARRERLLRERREIPSGA
ncbi:MAG TPA: ABC transporter permease [Synergistaceae bacterium]|nr:ABC transporter permease [Synergistaceae bacterium]HQF91359.1 ABC transporter permease [Synergistaceae bacterium]HQH78341.1 ABC transporter permease [Synergistaceae bacterium]HQK24963.1 ABC transporter permease [Synergistaceae bacterium]